MMHSLRRPSLLVATLALIHAVSGSCGGSEGSAPSATEPVITSVQVTAGRVTFSALRQTAQFTAEPRRANGAPVTGRDIIWSSANPAVASVTATGLVTAISNGAAVITAATGGITSSPVQVTVSQVVAALVVSPAGPITLVAVGATRALAAAARDSGGSAVTAAAVTWSSSDPGVASMSASGVVTAVANGATTVTAASGPVTGNRVTVTVAVPVAAASLTVTPSGPLRFEAIGATQALTAVARSADGAALPNAALTWVSSNSGIATVTQAGLVTAVSSGSAFVRVTTFGARVDIQLEVVLPALRLSFTEQPSNMTRAIGINPALRVSALDASGKVVPSFVGPVSLSLDVNPGAGRLTGLTTAIVAAGTATFSDLSVDAPGAGYRLRARTDGLADGVSNSFDAYSPPAPAPPHVIVVGDNPNIFGYYSPIALVASGTHNVTRVAHGSRPQQLVVTPNGAFAYVAAFDKVLVIALATGSLVTAIDVAGAGSGDVIGISADGRNVYLTGNTSAKCVVISTATNRVVATIDGILTPRVIVSAPDGSRVYAVSDHGPFIPGVVTVVDAVTHAKGTVTQVGVGPVNAAVSPDGAFLYVANLGDVGKGSLSIVATTSGAVSSVPLSTRGLALSPDGRFLYSLTGDSLSVVSASTRAIVAAIALPSDLYGSRGLVLSPDGSRALIVHQTANRVYMVNTVTRALTGTIGVGRTPRAAAFSGDGSRAYVIAADGTLSVIATATNTVMGIVGVGLNPVALGVSR